jgi:hypothetical protein
MISTLVTLPYELARLPLVVLDHGLSGPLPEASGPRVVLDRTIGSADKLAGTLLRNRGIAQRGADRLERTEKLVAAARLEQQAAARREEARETAAAGRQEATAKRKAAQERAASGLEEADAAEARGKQEAAARAAKQAATKQAAADRRAANRAAAAEQRQQQVDSTAEKKKQAAQRTAKAELEDARENQQSADEARADADRLDDLTAAKKEQRKQD